MTHHPVPSRRDEGCPARHGGPASVGRSSTGPRPLLAAALRAAETGWAVFPVRPRGKIPAVRDWERAASTDPGRLLEWWTTRDWNVGIAAGRSGLLVLDLDTPHPTRPSPPGGRDGHGPETATDDRDGNGQGRHVLGGRADQAAEAVVTGWDVLRRLAAEAGQAPPWDTFTVATPSHGVHLYFHQPPGPGLRNTQSALGPLIDTRGHGGYVLAVGSRGPGGRRYRVVRDVPVAPLPGWLHQVLTAPTATIPNPSGRHEPAAAGAAGTRGAGPPSTGVAMVSAARVAAYVRAVVDGEARAVATARVGTRHTTLLRAARRLGQWVGGGALTRADARAALTAAASGYVGVAGYTAAQVERDITDGLGYGAARPRSIDDIPDRPDTTT